MNGIMPKRTTPQPPLEERMTNYLARSRQRKWFTRIIGLIIVTAIGFSIYHFSELRASTITIRKIEINRDAYTKYTIHTTDGRTFVVDHSITHNRWNTALGKCLVVGGTYNITSYGTNIPFLRPNILSEQSTKDGASKPAGCK